MDKKVSVALKQLSEKRYRVQRLTNALCLTFQQSYSLIHVKVGDEITEAQAKELCERPGANVNVTLP